MIAQAFPGLFSFDRLLDLDIRDFYFWLRKAKVKLLEEERDFVGNVRIAVNGSADDVSDIFDSIKWRIRTVEEEEA